MAQIWDKSQLVRVAKVEGLVSSYLAHYWLLLGGLFIILVEEHTLQRGLTPSKLGNDFISSTGWLKVEGSFSSFLAHLYIELTLYIYLYLYFENTRSIYRKIILGLFAFYTVSSEEAYYF